MPHFEQLAADPLRAPEHVVFGHGLNERDDLRRETLRLTMGPGLSSPDDLEQIPMPAQQGLGTNHAQGVSPSTVQSGEREKHQAVVAVESRPPDAATQYDDLLSEQGVLGQELRSRTREITGGADPQRRSGASWPQQALERPAKGHDQGGDQVRAHSDSVS